MKIPRRLGPFLLTHRIGAGGMGTVYYGTLDGPAGRPAAVKVIRAEYADDPEFRARFRREIEVVSRVAGACTARVLAADPDGDPPYLATEYLAGPNLAEYVRQHGPLVGETLRTLAVGLAEALVAIHDAGVVHRDLKPSNVLLTREGPRVVDFGIAQAADTVSLTGAGSSVGSPAYMSPEQIRGGGSDPAMDVFAWGCTVAYAATGRSPFGGGPADAVLFRVRHDPANLEGVPGRLYALLARSLAKNAKARPDIHTLFREILALSDVGAAVSSEAQDTDLTALVNQVIAEGWLSVEHLDPRILDLDVRDVNPLPIVRAAAGGYAAYARSDAGGPRNLAGARDPVGSGNSPGPNNSARPASPVRPSGPVRPGSPPRPGHPAGVGNPAGVGGPAVPVAPGTSAAHVVPLPRAESPTLRRSGPVRPGGPGPAWPRRGPGQPSVPNQQSGPDERSTPNQPSTAGRQASSGQPSAPRQPTWPNRPSAAGQSSWPDQPSAARRQSTPGQQWAAGQRGAAGRRIPSGYPVSPAAPAAPAAPAPAAPPGPPEPTTARGPARVGSGETPRRVPAHPATAVTRSRQYQAPDPPVVHGPVHPPSSAGVPAVSRRERRRRERERERRASIRRAAVWVCDPRWIVVLAVLAALVLVGIAMVNIR
ncbi:protein kinase [Frankia sp. Mgl5]|uniref:serine/threonine-protein kinase n=1 Tax=Frankia sp. Mgl5 TaxID=2933793 RepID=UPI00200D084A|nr:serine/threonine-protein kinase [Frankia sp. Mgl5]MCK9928336.1 protein kinase [Frankia sp. Mgl5]